MADKTIMIKTVQDILKEENEVRAEDFYSLASSIYDSFDIAAHNKGTGYMTTNFPLLNAKIEGLEEGLLLQPFPL